MLTYIMCRARRNIRQHGNHTRTTERQNRHNLVIIAGVDRKIIARRCAQTQDRREIAARLLHADDARMLRKLRIRLRLDADPRTRRHIIENCRNADAVCNLRIVGNETILRAFVVVRRDEEERIGTDLFGILRQLDRVGRLIRARACNNGNAAAHLLHGIADCLTMLCIRHRRRFARRPRDDDGIRPARNLILNDTSELVVVYPGLRKRRNNGNARTAKNLFFHGKLPLYLFFHHYPTYRAKSQKLC